MSGTSGVGQVASYGPIIITAVAGVVAAGIGAGGVKFLEYFNAPTRLGKVMATGLWLSCHELLLHLESLKRTLEADPNDNETRRALRKIPRYDFRDRADWFVKEGYFCVITAYKIAVFSSWMRIYQTNVLRAALIRKSDKYTSELFQKFDSFKVGASTGTIFWYSYIDAIGERLIVDTGDYTHPLDFGDFCKKYFEDKQFRAFFEQLHMFIHFLGKTDPNTWKVYRGALNNMISALRDIEGFVGRSGQNLLARFRPDERRNRSTAGARWAQVRDEFPPDGGSP